MYTWVLTFTEINHGQQETVISLWGYKYSVSVKLTSEVQLPNMGQNVKRSTKLKSPKSKNSQQWSDMVFYLLNVDFDSIVHMQ